MKTEDFISQDIKSINVLIKMLMYMNMGLPLTIKDRTFMLAERKDGDFGIVEKHVRYDSRSNNYYDWWMGDVYLHHLWVLYDTELTDTEKEEFLIDITLTKIFNELTK